MSINKIIQSACIKNNPCVKKGGNKLTKKTMVDFGIAATVAGFVVNRVIKKQHYLKGECHAQKNIFHVHFYVVFYGLCNKPCHRSA
jgi:hypothetical protein